METSCGIGVKPNAVKLRAKMADRISCSSCLNRRFSSSIEMIEGSASVDLLNATFDMMTWQGEAINGWGAPGGGRMTAKK
jgi:hypothetical protein